MSRFFKEKLQVFIRILTGVSYVVTALKTLTIFSFSCSFAKVFWVKIERLLLWKMQHQNDSSLCSKMCKMNKKSKKGIIKFNTISVVLCAIWLERNNHTFKEKNSSTINLWEDTCALLGFWANILSLFTNFSVNYIALNLNAF